MVSGISRVTLYPRAAPTKANAIPVFPLVGSISSTPGFNNPRFSASQIIDAPMRHFTEYAGLRPSTLARIVTGSPAVTRFRRTRGVRPMLKELSLKICIKKSLASNIPVGHVSRLRFFPSPGLFSQGRLIQDRRDGRVHP